MQHYNLPNATCRPAPAADIRRAEFARKINSLGRLFWA